MHVPLNDVFKKLEGLGFEDIRHNYIIDKENAAMVADEYGIEVEVSDSSNEDLFPAPENQNYFKIDHQLLQSWDMLIMVKLLFLII